MWNILMAGLHTRKLGMCFNTQCLVIVWTHGVSLSTKVGKHLCLCPPKWEKGEWKFKCLPTSHWYQMRDVLGSCDSYNSDECSFIYSSVNTSLYRLRERVWKGGLQLPSLCLICKYTCFIFVASTEVPIEYAMYSCTSLSWKPYVQTMVAG